MHPLKKSARIAGAIYLSMVITGPFALIYVPNKLIMRGNAAATADNILAHETMFRLAILADLIGSVIFICLGIALYKLLSGVSKTWAGLMVAFVLVSAAVGFLNTLNNIAALTLFRGADFRQTTARRTRDVVCSSAQSRDLDQRDVLGVVAVSLGLLVFRSGFLPRFIGVWLMINCFGYVALSVTALFFPDYYEAAFKWAQPVLFGELAIMLWLLIKGAKVPTVPSTLQPATGGLAFR